MKSQTHINVTVDFSNWNAEKYDLRLPKYQTVKQLLINIQETLEITMPKQPLFAIRVSTKHLVIAGDDYIADYPVVDGDVLTIL